ncbi:MAG: hypothetical protein ACR2JV_08425 [Gaiellales bacterium]
MAQIVESPAGAGPVDLDEHAFEAGAIRLAVHGAEGSPLDFSDPAVREAIVGALSDDPFAPFAQEALAAHAPGALAALDAALPGHVELARLAPLWRPRLLLLAGRKDELTGEQTVVLRFEERLREIKRGMAEAEARGDEDAREALHAKYIEVGTTYAGRLAAREG